MATLMDLRRLTRHRMGVPISDDFLTDTVVDDHVNLAIAAIEAEYHWPWSDAVQLVTISPEVPDIPQPDGYRATRTIFDDTNELFAVSPGDLLTYLNAHGDPVVWCAIADAIAIRPIVGDTRALIHYWYRRPAWLVNDEDTTPIPDQYSGTIVAKAAQLLSDRESDSTAAGRHGAEYDDSVNRMRRDLRRATTPTRVRVRPGGWI